MIGKSVLIISQDDALTGLLPYFLSNCDLVVDFLGPSDSHLSKSRFLRHFYRLDKSKSIGESAQIYLKNNYDWILIGDDPTLGAILNSPIEESVKEQLLPVISKEYFDHVFSKINLSLLFKEKNIQTPPFTIVRSKQEALQSLIELGGSIFLKKNCSSGGLGNYLFQSDKDIQSIKSAFNESFLLSQKVIHGTEYHVDALFFNGKLIYFQASQQLKRVERFGPASVMRFITNISEHPQIHLELEKIGRSLGIHGFTNISYIEEFKTGTRYYIEADLRPTVWTTLLTNTSECLSTNIKNYFQGSTFPRNKLSQPNLKFFAPEYRVIPYVYRLPVWDLVTNKYNAWHYCKKQNDLIMFKITLKAIFSKKRKNLYNMFKYIERFSRPFFKKIKSFFS